MVKVMAHVFWITLVCGWNLCIQLFLSTKNHVFQGDTITHQDTYLGKIKLMDEWLMKNCIAYPYVPLFLKMYTKETLVILGVLTYCGFNLIVIWWYIHTISYDSMKRARNQRTTFKLNWNIDTDTLQYVTLTSLSE